MMPDRFPIISSWQWSTGIPHNEVSAAPRFVPWSFVESSRRRAERNHAQTLEQLAERGGLSPLELYLAVNDQPLFPEPGRSNPGERHALRWLAEEVGKLFTRPLRVTPDQYACGYEVLGDPVDGGFKIEKRAFEGGIQTQDGYWIVENPR